MAHISGDVGAIASHVLCSTNTVASAAPFRQRPTDIDYASLRFRPAGTKMEKNSFPKLVCQLPADGQKAAAREKGTGGKRVDGNALPGSNLHPTHWRKGDGHCGGQGDGVSDGPTRFDQLRRRWVHLNCPFWHEEVFEMVNGALNYQEWSMVDERRHGSEAELDPDVSPLRPERSQRQVLQSALLVRLPKSLH